MGSGGRPGNKTLLLRDFFISEAKQTQTAKDPQHIVVSHSENLCDKAGHLAAAIKQSVNGTAIAEYIRTDLTIQIVPKKTEKRPYTTQLYIIFRKIFPIGKEAYDKCRNIWLKQRKITEYSAKKRAVTC